MITIIRNGEIYAPHYIGIGTILVLDEKIAQIGRVNENIIDCGLEVEVIDATDCIIMPGIIDPHVHLIGGGGEGGFASRTPEIQLSEIIRSGITTVVGCLGTDGTTRHMTSLLAKARALEEEGISTYIYTGNYHVPPQTITGTVKDDIILIDKIIGAGEIAISDSRSAQPSVHEIAKLVAEARIGGMLSGKVGVTHFHIGPGKQKLQFLHQLLDEYEIPPMKLYCTHINRNEALIDDAIALAKKGSYVDITVEENTREAFLYYKNNGGKLSQLTLSSDGNGSLPVFDENGILIGLDIATPYTLFQQFVRCAKDEALPMEEVITTVTKNPATALGLSKKGRIEVGMDADLLILKRNDLHLNDVIAKGKRLVKNGEVLMKGTFEK